MSKANQKARFSIFNFFDISGLSIPNNLDRKLVYLDYDEIINRIPQVEQALLDIRARKREETHQINMISNKGTWTRIHLVPSKHNAKPDYIQRGFDIARKWNDDKKEGLESDI